MNKGLKARKQLLAGVSAILLVNIVQNAYVLLAAAILVLVLSLVAKLKGRVRLKAMLPMLFIALFMSVVQAVSIGSHILYSIHFAGLTLNLYAEGLARAGLTFLRIWGSMGTILLLMSHMKINEFISGLCWFRVPRALIEVMVIALKYIFIFADEAAAIRKAQRARLGYVGFRRSVVSIGNAAGMILSGAFDRSRALAKALKSRGYNGSIVHFE